MHRRRLLLDSLKVFDLPLMLASFGVAMLVVSSRLQVSSFESLFAMRVRLLHLFE